MTKIPSLLSIATFFFMNSMVFGTPEHSNKDQEFARMLFETTPKKPNQQSNAAHINAFILQKVKQTAATNKQFADDVILDHIDRDGEINYQQLDDEHMLVIVSTALHAYQSSGCLFLVNKKTGHWQPVILHKNEGYEKQNNTTYSVIIDNIDYTTPILNEWARGAGWYAGIGTQYIHVFQNGKFHPIRAVNYDLTEEGRKELDKNPDSSPDEFITSNVHAIDKTITKLYELNAPKGAPSLNELESWKRIFFVSSERAYLHEYREDKSQKKTYLVQGDVIYADKLQEKWVFIKYLHPTTHNTAEGWVKLSDLFHPDLTKDELDSLKL